MLKAWLDGIKEVVPDAKVKGIAQGAGILCLTLKLLLKFVDFWLAAEPGLHDSLLLTLEFNMSPLNLHGQIHRVGPPGENSALDAKVKAITVGDETKTHHADQIEKTGHMPHMNEGS